jgi:hypothetical protein
MSFGGQGTIHPQLANNAFTCAHAFNTSQHQLAHYHHVDNPNEKKLYLWSMG